MRDFRDAKAMAQTLRDALKSKSISLTHSESLELVAKSFGLRDWNVLSAAIEASKPPVSALQPVHPTIGSHADGRSCCADGSRWQRKVKPSLRGA